MSLIRGTINPDSEQSTHVWLSLPSPSCITWGMVRQGDMLRNLNPCDMWFLNSLERNAAKPCYSSMPTQGVICLHQCLALSKNGWHRSWLHWKSSCWQLPLRSAAEFASKWRFYRFSVFGNNLWAFDEFAYWFLNYQPSFYYCTAILLSILFHPILFPCISFQILFSWILFLMWAIYIYYCFLSFFQCTFTCMFYVSLFCAIVYMYICISIYLSIYWKSGTSDLMVLMLFVLQCTDYK